MGPVSSRRSRAAFDEAPVYRQPARAAAEPPGRPAGCTRACKRVDHNAALGSAGLDEELGQALGHRGGVPERSLVLVVTLRNADDVARVGTSAQLRRGAVAAEPGIGVAAAELAELAPFDLPGCRSVRNPDRVKVEMRLGAPCAKEQR
jgi:hypothetical protein